MFEFLDVGSVKTGDAVLEGVVRFDVGVGVLLLTMPLLVLVLFGVPGPLVTLVATDGDCAGEMTVASVEEVVTVVDDETRRGGVGVLELAGDMNSFKTPAGTDIMGAPAVSRSFMAGGEGGRADGAGVSGARGNGSSRVEKRWTSRSRH